MAYIVIIDLIFIYAMDVKYCCQKLCSTYQSFK
jgi:hypothetical protein